MQGLVCTMNVDWEKSAAAAEEMDLVVRAARGDPGERDRLINRLFNRVEKTVFSLLGARTDAEAGDLVQSALIQILRSAGSFRGDSSLEYWADRITVQTAAKFFTKKTRRLRIMESFSFEEAQNPEPEAYASLSEVRFRLNAHFALLPDTHRVPVVLHYLHGYTVDEIADLTNEKESTVRGRLRGGLDRLRKSIAADPGLSDWLH